MIFIWVVAFVALAVFGLVWYFVNIGVQMMIDQVVAANPTVFDTGLSQLIVNIWMWLPAFMVFTLLLWVYVNSQKPAGYPSY